MKFFKILTILFFTILIGIGVTAYSIHKYFNTSFINENKNFVVPKGANFHTILNKLVEEKIISKYNTIIVSQVSKFIIDSSKVKAGEYIFIKNSTLLEILRLIESGKVFHRKVTIAEGLTNDTIFKIIAQMNDLTGELPPPNSILEGTLLPETYYYEYGDTKISVIRQMQDAMLKFVNSEWQKRDENLPFNTKQEALSLASIVEKETGVPTERGKVASVFVNRLKKKMRLQSDPTVVYAFTMGNKELEREIRRSDLENVNDYNTYKLNGIPKRPIANPGKDAIRAVLHPEQTNYLYFVATGNGGHNFSTDLKSHNNFVKDYRDVINNK